MMRISSLRWEARLPKDSSRACRAPALQSDTISFARLRAKYRTAPRCVGLGPRRGSTDLRARPDKFDCPFLAVLIGSRSSPSLSYCRVLSIASTGDLAISKTRPPWARSFARGADLLCGVFFIVIRPMSPRCKTARRSSRAHKPVPQGYVLGAGEVEHYHFREAATSFSW